MYIQAMTTINTNLLDGAISEIGKNNIHYLVMNSRTRFLLASGNLDCRTYMSEHGNYTKYREIPISIYEGLIDGNIDFVTEVKMEV